jgi:hypothetical protein
MNFRGWVICALMALGFSSCGTTDGFGGLFNHTMVVQYPDGTVARVPVRGSIAGGQKAKNKPKKAERIIRAYEWYPEQSPSGPVKIVIVTTEQKAYVYRGGKSIGWTRVSTGKDGYETPHGTFKILQKSKDHKSSQYGKFVDAASGEVVNWDADVKMKVPPGCRYEPASMPYFLRITWDGVGLHSGIVPDHPASHGCIRVRKEMAPILFDLVKKGDTVVVVDSRDT